ncbi:MAG: TrbI/VirB10 family protein [Aulosira sp. DedQUE10]|nr:TrbI/VirB10 family protein [Aulosira sp. DedQUE10]
MTPYSSSAKNSKNHNYQLERDSLDWELRMAKLVGLENENLPSITDETREELATFESPLSQPAEVKTEQSFSSNPFAKLGLVGTATLAVVVFAGGFLTQMMSGSNQKPKKKNLFPEVKSPVVNESPSQELEIETLKTKLALTEQAEAVKLAQQQLRSTQIPQPIASKPTLKSNAPRIVTVERIVDVPHPPQPPVNSQPLPPPQIIATQPDIKPAVNVTPAPKLDPYQMWTNLAKLGSYGQVSVNDQPPADVNNSTANTPNMEQQANNPQPNPTPTPENTTANQADPSTLIATKQGKQSDKSIAVGSSVKAVLATAVFGETANAGSNNDNETPKNTFVVRLQEPLKSANGNVAIPAGTELLTEIRSLSEQGLLQLNVVKAIAKDNNQITENSLPPNAIIIRGSHGKPLLATQFPNRGSSIAGMDLGLFVLGGLGKAAELMNRSESQVVTTNAGGTVVSSNNPQQNLLAGVLEGGMNTVVPQIAQRNQQAVTEMMQRTNVWFLPAGTEVEIYVNQAMEF